MKHHRVAQRILIRNHINPNCKWNMKILSGMKNYYSTEIFLLRQAGKVNIRELKKIIIKHFCNKLFQCSWNIEWALRNCRLPIMMRTETRMSWGRWQRRQRPYQLSQLTPHTAQNFRECLWHQRLGWMGCHVSRGTRVDSVEDMKGGISFTVFYFLYFLQ